MNIETKVCGGPAHAQPTRLPLDPKHWYFHKRGRYAGQALDRCKLCANWAKLSSKEGPHGTVPVADVQAWAQELLDRVGSYEAVHRAYGLRPNTLGPIVLEETERVQLRTVQRILVGLAEQRKVDRRNGMSARFRAALRAQADREEKLSRLVGY